MIEDYGEMREQFKLAGMSCQSCVGRVRSGLSGIKGLSIENVSVGSATLRYYPHLLSRERIVMKFAEIGYPVAVNAKPKGWWNRFLYRMIESNQKSFGNRRLDCCDLNKKPAE